MPDFIDLHYANFRFTFNVADIFITIGIICFILKEIFVKVIDENNYIYNFFNLALKSCSSMKEAGQVLRNEKVKQPTSFWSKKQPLILPPNYEKIPEQDLQIKNKLMIKKK